MLRSIALDDEPPALRILETYCAKTDQVSLHRTFTKPSEAKEYLQRFPVDLLFLDIQMPAQTGIEFFKSLQIEPMVIFTTAFSEYAVEGFNLSAIDYLLKPYPYPRFFQAVQKATAYHQFQTSDQQQSTTLFLRADYRLLQIQVAQILCIEAFDDYIRIHLEAADTIIVRMTMKAILEKLSGSSIFRVHRSFAVALDKIHSVRNKIIRIGTHDIPIGRSYEQDFANVFPI